MGEDSAKLIKRTEMIRSYLDSPDRDFVPSELADASYRREYLYMEHAKQIYFFAESEVGDLSEAHILYAVRVLGVCTKQQIAEFLAIYKSKHPTLSILDTYYSIEGLERRLANLKKYGYLYSVSYSSRQMKSLEGNDVSHTVTLYLISEPGVYLMTNLLGKRLACDRYLEASPLSVIIARGAVSLQATLLMKSKYFDGPLEGIFRDRWIGAWYLPCELKFNVEGKLYYVMFHYGFLIRDDRRQTEEDFDNQNFDRVRLLKQYLSRRTKKGEACAIITVLDDEDLMNFGYLLYDNMELVGEHLDRIYFTGEGTNRVVANSKDRFLRMELSGDSKNPIYFIAETPPFA